ncbi:MAG TPA: hypothetical protein VF784_11920 [Anaerolineales bacterium]
MRLQHRRRIVLTALAVAAWCAGCSAPAQPSPVPTIPARTTETPAPTQSPTAVPNSPTPEATLAPLRAFTEEFDAIPAHWSFLQINNGPSFAGPSSRDGFLVFDLPSSNEWAYALYDGQVYTDVTVETEAQDRSGGDGAVGLVCRYDEKLGWYELNIFSDQTYELLFAQWLAPGLARYTPLFRGHSDAIQVGSNRIGLQCQGTLLTPVINGIPAQGRQETQYGLQQGKVGLTVSSFQDAPFTIAFDWVKVDEP